MLKKILLLLLFVLISGCEKQDINALKVGTISGPETQLMETAKKVAKDKYGLNIKIVEFSDYIQPNAALNDGSIDANMVEHQPFLDQLNKNRHYQLVGVAKTFVYPMGIYSAKIKSLKDLKDKAKIAIPNDPSNEGRALLLLQKAGLIRLDKSAGLYPTLTNIIDNPKRLQFSELDGAQIPRSLSDVDIAIINTNYAIPAGLSPAKDAIFLEDKDSPYVNIIVVRTDKINDARIKQLIAAFQSEEVIKEAQLLFKDEAIPAWQKK